MVSTQRKETAVAHPNLLFHMPPGVLRSSVAIHSVAPVILRRFLLRIVLVLSLVAQVIIPATCKVQIQLSL